MGDFIPGTGWDGKAGVGLYPTSFELDVPGGWDMPIDFVFNGTEGGRILSALVGTTESNFSLMGFSLGNKLRTLPPSATFCGGE
jgi:hypothetical protein